MSILPRIQFFEFDDQAWMPKLLKEAVHDGLTFIHSIFNPYLKMWKPFAEAAREAGVREILDLGSGAGGHAISLIEHGEEHDETFPRIILSDLFPNIEAFRDLSAQYGAERIGFIEAPVDASNVTSNLRFRSIFSAFHHFDDELAAKVIQDALSEGKGIFIAEPFGRGIVEVLLILPGLLIFPFAQFFSPHPSPLKFLFTLLIPIVPILLVFDGMVSSLRMRTSDEILNLIPAEERKGLQIRTGTCKGAFFTRSTYFYALKGN